MSALSVAQKVRLSEAEGPGRRYAIWTQGCSIQCPGCCNPELFGASGGTPSDTASLAREVVAAANELGLEGLTVLGGEPLDQLDAVTDLCAAVGQAGLGVIVFTGYRLAEALCRPGFVRLWRVIDTLVDGRYLATRHYRDLDSRPGLPVIDPPVRFLGSDNQRLYHRTPRYAPRELWHGSNSAEIHIDRTGRVSIHGHPIHVRELTRRLGLSEPNESTTTSPLVVLSECRS